MSIPGRAGPPRYLVTGGAGFIGSHVVEQLLRRGATVTVLDNFDHTYDPARKRRNLAWATAHRHFRLVTGDIRDPEALTATFAAGPFDAVVHLAARAGVRPSIADPESYDSVNVLGTTAVLQAVRAHRVPHVVLASSSSVYGATSRAPFGEDQPADRPSSPYAATKRANELAAYTHHHLYGTTVSCLRFFTVYGPRQRPEMAIHKFTRLIEAGQPVPVFGDGASQRDYTYIVDIVDGVLAAIDRPAGYRIYNLGTTATIGLLDLIGKIGDRLERPVAIEHKNLEQGDVPLTHADIRLASRELAYHPTTSIDSGLDSFIEWYRETATTHRPPQQPEGRQMLELRLVDGVAV